MHGSNSSLQLVVLVWCLDAAPRPPVGIHVYEKSHSALLVWDQWEFHDDVNNVDAVFRLSRIVSGRFMPGQAHRVSAMGLRRQTFVLKKLEPFTTYDISVDASNSVGTSSSVRSTFRTLAAGMKNCTSTVNFLKISRFSEIGRKTNV